MDARCFRVFIVFSALLILLTVNDVSAVPGMINYQGNVYVGEEPFTGTGQFKFAVVDGEGHYLWSNDDNEPPVEEPVAVIELPVTEGSYNVILGREQDMVPVPHSLFENEELYLRIWFNDGINDFQLLVPDQRIVSVGYSMKTKQAEDVYDKEIHPRSVSITGYTRGMVINEEGQWVGDASGLTGPTGPQGDTGPMGPTGPSGGGFWQQNESGIYFDDGNVGIGSAAKSNRKLDIYQYGTEDDNFGLRIYSFSDGVKIIQPSSLGSRNDFEPEYPTLALSRASSSFGASLEIGNTDNSFYLYADDQSARGFRIFSGNNVTDPLFQIRHNGCVGIGTNNPQYKLHIEQTQTGNDHYGLYVKSWSDGAFIVQPSSVGGTSNPTLTVHRGSSSNSALIAVGNATRHAFIEGASGNLTFKSNNGTIRDAMRIQQDGDIGIGTTNPGNWQLYVAGDVRVNDYLCALGGIHVGGTSDPGTDDLLVDGDVKLLNNRSIRFKNTSGTLKGILGVDSNNKVWIGNSALNNVIVNDHLLPNSSLKLGNSANRWHSLWISEKVHCGGKLGDLAEAVRYTETVEPGDVIAIDGKSQGFKICDQAYCPQVAGIASGTAKLVIGESKEKNNDIPLSLAGILHCKVTACNGPIEAGDLLTSSNLCGYAMKYVSDENDTPGTIIAKALEPWAKGEGLIEVLVWRR